MINFFNNKYYKIFLFRYVCNSIMENNTINILVIFGATGDLANRKIYPALNEISKSDKIPENFKIIGCGRKELKENIFSKLQSNLASNCDYIKLDPMIEDDYKLLSKKLNNYKNSSTTLNVIFYLSTPPRAYKPIIDKLINNKLNIEESGYRRIIIEKPFGKNLESARKLTNILTSGFKENQIFRIDHYLGKETVQNILVLRFTNLIFNALWSKDFISYIEITAAESIGIKGRGEYYDNSGAIRDMFQNHLLELLCLVSMEEPNQNSSESIRNEKIKVLNNIRKINFKDDMIRGFKIGADDYLIKPFDSEVLLLKIKSIFKRKIIDNTIKDLKIKYTFSDFTFNSKFRTLKFKNEEEITLSPKESKLLNLLLENQNDLTSREEALVKIWNDDNYFTSRSMDVYVTKIRKYLKKDSNISIENIHGKGFKLNV